MSQYEFTAGQDRWTVGWDPAVGSYFALVEPGPPADASAHALVVVAGDDVGEVPTVDELDRRLAGRVRIPDPVRRQLAGDGRG